MSIKYTAVLIRDLFHVVLENFLRNHDKKIISSFTLLLLELTGNHSMCHKINVVGQQIMVLGSLQINNICPPTKKKSQQELILFLNDINTISTNFFYCQLTFVVLYK